MAKQTFTTGQVLTAAQVNSLQANDFNQTVSVKTANYTLAAADKGTRIEFNTSGSVTCTVNSGLFDAGDTLVIQNRGAGTATITAGTATVNTSASLALAQYSAGTLYFVSDSAALFFGDAAGISASIVDAKGDLIVGTADNTVGRLAVGTNGYTLVAKSSEATGLAWEAPATGVNKNYLINGGFAIAQRGTSFTASANNDDAYTLDRWYILSDTNDVIDVTQDTSTVPTNGQFAIALDVETVNKKFGIATIIENKDCVGLIGNTVTFSFKAKVSATTKLDNVKAAIVAWSGTADTVTSDIISAWGAEGTNPTLIANATYENSPANLNLTTSYATYSISAAVDTASTKNIILFIWSDVTDTTLGDFLYIAEAKLELGSSATAFQYAGGTLEGELAACLRYFNRFCDSTESNVSHVAMGRTDGLNTESQYVIRPVVKMRAVPTFTVSAASDFRVNAAGTNSEATSITANAMTSQNFNLVVSSGALGTNSAAALYADSTTSARMDASAEL